MMSKRSLLMVTTLMLAGNSAMAGDVLRVDAVEAVLTGSFQQSCDKDGGNSFSLTADDFAQFPISIDESFDCSGFGSLESSTDGSFSDNRLEMKCLAQTAVQIAAKNINCYKMS